MALAHRSQLKLMYGDHHQQPQKDCCYDELDPFPVSGEEHPVHGQPPSGYHAPPNPIHYHILRLMTNPPMVLCYPSASGQPNWMPILEDWLAGAPGLQWAGGFPYFGPEIEVCANLSASSRSIPPVWIGAGEPWACNGPGAFPLAKYLGRA